jgi:hypothetical protein
MDMKEYFESTKGRGILATADQTGKVNLAMYARPYFIDENTITFIMADRLTHANLKSNPWASYLFTEEEWKYQGQRLYLKKIKEEENPDLIAHICRECDYSHYETGNQYVVYFTIEKALPLIGGGDSA